MISKLKTYLIALFSLVFTQSAEAQDNNSSISEDLKKIWSTDNSTPSEDIYPIDILTTNDAGTGNGTDNVLDAPIDGGLGFLMAAGILYGAKRIRRTRSHNLKK